MSATKLVPVEIGRANQHDVRIRWNDGHESVYMAHELRLRCGCAGCVSEMTGEEMLDPSSVPADVHPLSISLVGRYAIQIHWSDGHATGIYTFEHLRALGQPYATAQGAGQTHPE